MTNGGHGTELPERNLMVADRLSGQIVPPLISYHYHGRHAAQTLLGSEKMMPQLKICVFTTHFSFSCFSETLKTDSPVCLTHIYILHPWTNSNIYPESRNLFHYTALMTDPNSWRLTNSGNATICNGRGPAGSDGVYYAQCSSTRAKIKTQFAKETNWLLQKHCFLEFFNLDKALTSEWSTNVGEF